MHQIPVARGFCDLVCLQYNRIHAVVDLQYWGYLFTFLSSEDTVNIPNNCSSFRP